MNFWWLHMEQVDQRGCRVSLTLFHSTPSFHTRTTTAIISVSYYMITNNQLFSFLIFFYKALEFSTVNWHASILKKISQRYLHEQMQLLGLETHIWRSILFASASHAKNPSHSEDCKRRLQEKHLCLKSIHSHIFLQILSLRKVPVIVICTVLIFARKCLSCYLLS